MKASAEPDFFAQDYITITKDPRTELVVAIGGNGRAAGILQRAGGFLAASGNGWDYHRLPHGLAIEQQRLKATAASHALLTAGHSVHLDPALNALAKPDGERESALRYLAQLSERAARAESATEIAEILTAVAGPVEGLLPLTRDVVARAVITCSRHLNTGAKTPNRSPSSRTRRTRCCAPPTKSSSPAIKPRAPQKPAPATTPPPAASRLPVPTARHR